MFARTALSVAAAAILAASAVHAAPFAASGAQSATATAAAVVTIAKKRAQRRDCTPYNGPYGFYGNIWCQPPSEMSYLRNLSSPWPQQTPPALKKVKPDYSNDW